MALELRQESCSHPVLESGVAVAFTAFAGVYGKAGVKGKFEGRFHDEPHKFTIKMQDEAFAFLNRHLKG